MKRLAVFLQTVILITAIAIPALVRAQEFELDRKVAARRLLKEMPPLIQKSFRDKLEDRTIVDQILRAYDEKYRAAREAQDKGDERCLKLFEEAHEKHYGPSVIDGFLRAQSMLNRSKFLVETDEYEVALKELEFLLKYEEEFLPEVWEARYLLGLSCAKLATEENGLGAGVEELLKAVEEDEETPPRYKESARWIASEIHEGLGGRLATVAERAEHLSAKISQGDTGKDVQKRQERLVQDLDELVQTAQKQEEQTLGRKPGGEEPDKDPKHETPKRLGREQGPKDWEVALNALERARALQILDKMPLHYRELINQYFKALADGPNKKKKE